MDYPINILGTSSQFLGGKLCWFHSHVLHQNKSQMAQKCKCKIKLLEQKKNIKKYFSLRRLSLGKGQKQNAINLKIKGKKMDKFASASEMFKKQEQPQETKSK